MPLVLDTFCEIHSLLKPWATDEFWDLTKHNIVPGAIYLIGRQQFTTNVNLIKSIAASGKAKIILSNPHEGSSTIRQHMMSYGYDELMFAGRMLLIAGGDMDSAWPYLQYESFLPKLFDYKENIDASKHIDKIYEPGNKPFKFMFLNGRCRSHRWFLLKRWKESGLLDQCLWTNLDRGPVSQRTLPKEYEYPKYQTDQTDWPWTESHKDYVKHQLFKNDWGEIYLYPNPYIDTYFSVITETVHDYPYSFRTEKIWKPIVMGHPWLVSSNYGFLRDIRNLGFRTFGHLIDESYDLIENSQTRINKFAATVEDLAQQDLPSFLAAAKDVCKYNQQHYIELRPKIRNSFPEQFFQFLRKHQWEI